MTDNQKIVMLSRSLLHPHPDNPRKDLGDLTELRESIRAHGIMQNLTVLVDEGEDADGYTILIGHRRFAASEGILDQLPCVVVKGLSDREQVGIMLLENIQRSDLTFVEQAHGFQMMMDLGETVETISKKTGFSGTTIKHRLEIAKLSDKAINHERSWQLSLSDLIELEKIPNVKERERILKESNDQMNFRYKIRNSLQEMTKTKNLSQAKKWFKELGIKEDTKANIYGYNSDFKVVYECRLCEEEQKNFNKENFEKLLKKHKTLMWQENWGTLRVFKKITKEDKKKAEKTPEELKRDEELKASKKLSEYGKQAGLSYGHFIMDLPLDQAKKVADGLHNESEVWNQIIKREPGIGSYVLNDFIKDYNARCEYWKEVFPTYPAILQMLMLLISDVIDDTFLDWSWRFNQKTVDLHKFIIEQLKPFGYSFPEDIPQGLFDFNDELYALFVEYQKEDEETDDEEGEGDE